MNARKTLDAGKAPDGTSAAKRNAATPPRIVIAGSGLAGLSLGLALKRGLGNGITVTICDPMAEHNSGGDTRAYSIAAAGRQMFEVLGIWSEITARVQPIHAMSITDSSLRDPVRQEYLTFTEDERTDGPLAHMVEARVLTPALLAACRQSGVEFVRDAVVRFEPDDDLIGLRLGTGGTIQTQLLVVADGARSHLRELAGIGWIGWPYRQSAIVATIRHEREHEGRAVQHFLPSGPFAILPLCDGEDGRHRSLIVWSERTDEVEEMLRLDADGLLEEIERRFGRQLGTLSFEVAPKAFPLSFGVVRRFYGNRLALLGDAAHVVHPIAGQGLNLGLGDVAALAEEIADAVRLGLDVGSEQLLSAYERHRRADTAAMGMVTDGMNRLFSNDFLPVRLMRDLGLGAVDRFSPLKEFLMRAASQINANAPRLMRGEAL